MLMSAPRDHMTVFKASRPDGSFNCSCDEGYIGDGKTFCKPKGKDLFCIGALKGLSFDELHINTPGKHC